MVNTNDWTTQQQHWLLGCILTNHTAVRDAPHAVRVKRMVAFTLDKLLWHAKEIAGSVRDFIEFLSLKHTIS